MKWPWAPEGWTALGVSAVACVCGLAFALGTGPVWLRCGAWGLAGLGALAGAIGLVFFRDPERTSDLPLDRILAPADGRVMAVETVNEPRVLGGPARRIAIFMHLGNVHVQRVPSPGRLLRVEHRPGRFHAAFRPEAARENEQRWYAFASAHGAFAVVQIAGLLARRTIAWVRPGTDCDRGTRLGMIAFGSEVDTYLPPAVRVEVKPGDRVRAGKTVIATWPR